MKNYLITIILGIFFYKNSTITTIKSFFFFTPGQEHDFFLNRCLKFLKKKKDLNTNHKI